MRALSIRQPYAELILRGVKTVEYRSFATRIIGERFYLYAAKGSGVRVQGSGTEVAERIWSDDLAVPGRSPGAAPPPWMLELAELLILDKLPRGLIVGTAVIERCEEVRDQKPEIRPASGLRPLTPAYQWHLADVKRLASPRKPRRRPQPSWFKPF